MTNDALTQLFSEWGPVYMAMDADLLISNLRAELATAQSECLEQARLNGMGSEREAALMAKLEAERAKVGEWKDWDRSMPMPDGLYPVITLEGFMEIAPGKRFYKDGVVKYWTAAISSPDAALPTEEGERA